MEKESVALIMIVVIVITAIIISINLTGKITQIQPTMIPIDQIIKEAKVTSPPDSPMIEIKQAVIEKITLEKFEQLLETDCIPVIAWYQPEILEQAIEQIKQEKKALPFEISAIAPIELESLPTLPFTIGELEDKIKEDVIKEAAIKELHEKIIAKFTLKEFSEVNTFKNFGGAYGCLNPEGFAVAIDEPLIITGDVLYKHAVYESIDLIGADMVWRRQAADKDITGKGINVAIIDSGIDYRHDELGGCMGPNCRVIKGWNTITHNEDVIDTDGHGTHLAGIVASVAPDANIIAIKACQGGFCSASKIAEGIDWCLDHDCHVATLSLGDGGSHPPKDCKKLQTLKPVFEAAADRNLVIFVSSGNEGKPWPAYPACDADVTSVGSVNDFDDMISDFSNLHPDVLAPGTSITSTWLNNEYAMMAGTSQAAAFAAATAALYIQTYAALKKRVPTPLLIEEQFETSGKLVYDRINNIEYPRINAAALISTLLGEEPLPSFVCGNFKCEFKLGEDAQNCPQDCKVPITIPPAELENYILSFDIKDWQERLTPVRVEIRGEVRDEILVKDFMYDYYTTEINLPEAVYDVKLSYGNFSTVLRSIKLNKSLNLKIKLEDLTGKVKEISGFPHAQVKAAYAFGFEHGSAIVCFDRKLAGNNTFVFRCSWDDSCKDKWVTLMSMEPRETSCLLLIPRAGTAFAIAEIPEAVCGNGICEPSESDVSCPKDCKLKEAALIIKEERPLWPLFVIFAIAIALVILGIFLKKIKQTQEKGLLKPPSPLGLSSSSQSPTSLSPGFSRRTPKPPKPPKPPKSSKKELKE